MPKADLTYGNPLASPFMYERKPTRPNGLAGREGLPYVYSQKTDRMTLTCYMSNRFRIKPGMTIFEHH